MAAKEHPEYVYLNFRHPGTGVVVLVHPLEEGLARVYARHGWGLLLKTENIFGPALRG